MNDLFEQICKVVNPDNSGALEKSMNNFDALHAELMEAVELLKAVRADADLDLGSIDTNLMVRIDNFLTKHS